MHLWDWIKSRPDTWSSEAKVHESVFRSYQILEEVKRMLAKGDSPETIQLFIQWAEKRQ